jgi:hypothetical protein
MAGAIGYDGMSALDKLIIFCLILCLIGIPVCVYLLLR